MTQLKSQKGTFALLLEVPPNIPFHVFAQSGPVALPPGFYLYVESAFEAGGVKERVEHHFRDLSPYIMVLDYFYAEMKMHEAWFTYDAVERTCQWAGLVQEALGGQAALPGFMLRRSCGSGCRSHCFPFAERPTLAKFRRAVARLLPGHAPIQRIEHGELDAAAAAALEAQ